MKGFNKQPTIITADKWRWQLKLHILYDKHQTQATPSFWAVSIHNLYTQGVSELMIII